MGTLRREERLARFLAARWVTSLVQEGRQELAVALDERNQLLERQHVFDHAKHQRLQSAQIIGCTTSGCKDWSVPLLRTLDPDIPRHGIFLQCMHSPLQGMQQNNELIAGETMLRQCIG
jgi:hypothetical protein